MSGDAHKEKRYDVTVRRRYTGLRKLAVILMRAYRDVRIDTASLEPMPWPWTAWLTS